MITHRIDDSFKFPSSLKKNAKLTFPIFGSRSNINLFLRIHEVVVEEHIEVTITACQLQFEAPLFGKSRHFERHAKAGRWLIDVHVRSYGQSAILTDGVVHNSFDFLKRSEIIDNLMSKEWTFSDLEIMPKILTIKI